MYLLLSAAPVSTPTYTTYTTMSSSSPSLRKPEVVTTACKDKDFLPVSKFSKYTSHLVCSNKHFIVYTPSKRGIVRAIFQDDGSHIALDTEFSSIALLHLWESGSSSSLLAVGSPEGKFAVWEIYYPGSANAGKYELRQTFSLMARDTQSSYICKSIPGTRYFAIGLHECIHLYDIYEKEPPQRSHLVLQCNTIIKDFTFSPQSGHLAICTSQGVLLTRFSIEMAIYRGLISVNDLPNNWFVNVISNASKVWFLTSDSYSGTFLLVGSDQQDQFVIINEDSQVVGNVGTSPLVKPTLGSLTKYDPLSNTLFLGSPTPGGALYFLTLSDLNGTPSLGRIQQVTLPADFHPLEFSLTENIDKKTPDLLVDLFIFHTKGLSILPLNLSKTKGSSTPKAKPNGSTRDDSLKTQVQAQLAKFKRSSRFPPNISDQSFEDFENLLVQSGVLKVISEHVESSILAKLESRFQELEVSSTAPPSSGDIATTAPETEVASSLDSVSSKATPIASPVVSDTSVAANPPSEPSVLQEEQHTIVANERELTSQEYVLLSAISNFDLSGAVRLATTNVSHVSLTRVLDTYVVGQPEREMQLVDTLLSGDALVLLSFIAVLSADLSKNEGPAAFASCLNWLHKLIVLINDNFARYQSFHDLINQVYGRTRNILAALPNQGTSPAGNALIEELGKFK